MSNCIWTVLIRRRPSRSRAPMLTRGMAGLKPSQHRFVMTLIGWGAHDWPALVAIGSVTARREIRGSETRSFIMNKKLTPEHLLRHVQSHWAIENALHWVLDVTMSKNYLRNRTGLGPENLAVMRRLALNLARLAVDKRTPSTRGRLKKAGWNHN